MIENSTFDANTADGNGGAIFNSYSLTVTASTFSNNGKAGFTSGGAIANWSGASAKITNSTFVGNVGSSGGATDNSGVRQVKFCTFSGN